MSIEERFWRKVAKAEGDGCWLWLTRKNRMGYGQFWLKGRTVTAHRTSYELEFGPVPSGLCVLHHCDVPACVRPDHLWIGTNADNMRDMTRKGREARGARSGRHTKPERTARGEQHGRHSKPECTARGLRNGQAKLTEEHVRLIHYEYHALHMRYWQLGIRFGVAASTIGRVITGQFWKHVAIDGE